MMGVCRKREGSSPPAFSNTDLKMAGAIHVLQFSHPVVREELDSRKLTE